MSDTPLLEVRGLQVWRQLRRRRFAPAQYLRAVDDVSLTIGAGESLGLVGETGCGKSTLGRAIMRLVAARAGAILLCGEDMLSLRGAALRRARRFVQMVFQDPQGSLNPRRSAAFSVSEPLFVHGVSRGEARHRVVQALEWVGLDAAALHKYPHQLSGGQRQRVAFARAVVLRPKLIVADEPVSALDMSVQAQTLNLMRDLQRRLGLGYLFISHDLAVVAHMCERVAVMYLGKIVEVASRAEIFSAAGHPYTRGLLSCALPPAPGVKLSPMPDETGAAVPPDGCRFYPRCRYADGLCRTRTPPLRERAPGHFIACHHAERVAAEAFS